MSEWATRCSFQYARGKPFDLSEINVSRKSSSFNLYPLPCARFLLLVLTTLRRKHYVFGHFFHLTSPHDVSSRLVLPVCVLLGFVGSILQSSRLQLAWGCKKRMYKLLP